MRRKIIWTWWKNPLDETDEYVDESAAPPDREFETYDEEAEPSDRMIVATPGGFVPVSVYGEPFRHFNFWIGHTNFTIDEDVRDVIKGTEGVETCEILTRYRFRVGFGLAFDDTEVRREIQEVLDANPFVIDPVGYELDAAASRVVEMAKAAAREAGTHWLVYLLPNLEAVPFGSEDKSSYKERLEFYMECQDYAGGVIFTSHDY